MGNFALIDVNNPPTKVDAEYFLLCDENCTLIGQELISRGIEKIKEFDVDFVYSDGFLSGTVDQPLYLPCFKPNLLDDNSIVINMPILTKASLNVTIDSRLKQLKLLSLFKQLCSYYIGYHLAEFTYSVKNIYTGDIGRELKIING